MRAQQAHPQKPLVWYGFGCILWFVGADCGEGKAQLLGTTAELAQFPFLPLLLISVRTCCFVGFSIFQQMIDDPCYFVRRRNCRLLRAFPRTHRSIVGANC